MFNKLKATASAIAIIALLTSAVAVAPAQAKVEGDTITFGVAVSLTGRYAVNGKHTKNGYDLAVKLINEKGGLTVAGKKYKLAVKYYDDESTAQRATQLAERLIQQDKIKFVLGPYSSGMTKAIAPVMEKYKVPMVEGNGASRSIFNQGFKYTFAVLSTSEQYLKSAIDLAAEVAKKEGRTLSSVKIAIGVRNEPFALDIGTGIREDAARYGMKVVVDEKFPKEVTDMTSFLTKVKALKPDVVVVSAHTVGGALFVRQMTEQKVSVPMVAMTHCESAKVTDTKIFGTPAKASCAPVSGRRSYPIRITCSARPWITPTPSRRPTATFRRIRQPNRRQRSWFMLTPLHGPVPSIRIRFATRWRRRIRRPSTAT